MKARETFERIRRKKNGFSLRVRLTLVISAEIVVSILLAFALSELLSYILPASTQIPFFLQLIIWSVLIGALSTRYLSNYFFYPIKQLRLAMEKVADGDFSVRLETKSSSQEIQEVYSGFNLMMQELSATEVLQSDFVSSVSHEFKTPINAIEGYTMLLQGGDHLDEEQREYVDKILFNTQRLSGLVSDILLLSKIENQSIETNRVWFRLDEQIRQSIVALESAWTEKEIEFDVEMANIKHFGNESLLYHVWENLISNAIKFSPYGGFIRIRLTQSRREIVFTVEDNGPGISEKDQKHIFDKFYQGDSSHKQEGNGLGLALVKQILVITGGEISVENKQDSGCRFTVTLKE